ncbi:M23 family metallopeptidase [Sulfurimonas sp. SAG-AH-194-I05]|nr:M23 family metallopeptidase [Sulfurimonas sp. SAG-AH-194-I05]MDF1874559.1 M23 family metallopeptidase [Sulfurimonas sp. SAG-AH-194-I05]
MGKSKSTSTLGLLLFGLIIAGIIYVYKSSSFERDKAVITMQTNGYWNLKQSVGVDITDESGVKSYKILLKTADGESVITHEQLIEPMKTLHLDIKPPRSAYSLKEDSLTIVVEINDASSWNFMKGNFVRKEFEFIIDKRRPQTSILSNSYKISKGGSALVIFRATDDNLKDIYIESNNNKKFKPQPFYKDGYYISLLAWSLKDKDFKAVIVAKDYAGNIKKTHIPLYLKNKKYRTSTLKISSRYLETKTAQLAEEFVETQAITDPVKQFQIINEVIRGKNEDLIRKYTSVVSDEMIDDFRINKMYPLRNGKVAAYFGDHRYYNHNGKRISEAYHMGLDLASVAMAEIKPQNGGKVVYSDYNGIYGNMPIIDHGLGLYTLYGHCSSTQVNVDDYFSAKNVLANTGKTGAVMGDHLHFGVLVQGIEVRPQEWMDSKWIKLNITDVIKNAKEIINKS